MAKPSAPYSLSALTWATDTNFSSGDENGQTTKAEPSAGLKGQGHVPGFAFRSAHQNWYNYGVSQWLAYLDNLPAETAFTGQPFVWGSDHTWVEPNSLRFASNQNYQRQVSPLLGPAWGTAGQNWEQYFTGMRSTRNSTILYVPINQELRNGCTLDTVDTYITPGAARTGTNRTNVSISVQDKATGVLTVVSGPIYDNTGTLRQFITNTPGLAIDLANNLYFVAVQAGNDGATNKDVVDSIQLNFHSNYVIDL